MTTKLVPEFPTMGQWDDFCEVFPVPFDKFILAYKAAIAAAPADPSAEGVSDERLIGLIINGCDTLDITRMSELKNGEWHATTIFDGDAALLRVVKAVVFAAPTSQRDPGALKTGCTRSHPHENMDEECEQKTIGARAANASKHLIADAMELDELLARTGGYNCERGSQADKIYRKFRKAIRALATPPSAIQGKKA